MEATSITLPEWTSLFLKENQIRRSAGDQVRLAIRLSELNVTHQTGGPFGAAVFDAEGRLISVGVNRVIPENCSLAHAEIVALMLAQSAAGRYRLDLDPAREYTLASSAQPCAMCFGALLWSGIRLLRFGAGRDDVISLTGFDEGPLPDDWRGELLGRGCRVEGPILSEAACDILTRYKTLGGILY